MTKKTGLMREEETVKREQLQIQEMRERVS